MLELKPKSISTHWKKITKLLKLKDLSQSPCFNLYGTIILAIVIIVLKGAGGEGQTTFFDSFVRKYVEETSASVLSPDKATHTTYLADISSLTAWENSSGIIKPGQGGS